MRLLLVVVLVVAINCGGSNTTTCVPGDSQACTGPGPCSGYQVCQADRTYSACMCGGSAGGGGGGAGSAKGGATGTAGATSKGGGSGSSATAGSGGIGGATGGGGGTTRDGGAGSGGGDSAGGASGAAGSTAGAGGKAGAGGSGVTGAGGNAGGGASGVAGSAAGAGGSSGASGKPGSAGVGGNAGGGGAGGSIGSVCGNGVKEAGESCDCGTDPTALPSGCTGPNGLFNGDGTGCSRTCTKEPTCRDSSGKTGACATSCGNGNIEPGEDCDDGNQISGDGCSSTCHLETGFSCQTVQSSDQENCTQSLNQGETCLELPVKYRDFKNESVSGGHPDFLYMGAQIPNPITVNSTTHGTISFKQRYCVPNSAGPARKNDSTARCWDLAQSTLDANGRPAFNSARTGGTTCDCQFTDWSHNGGSNNIVPGYGDATTAPRPLSGLPYVNSGNALGSPWYQGPAPVVSGNGSTFSQWWADGTYESDGTTAGKHAIGVLELGPVTGGATNLYRFSSAPHVVWGGFYPLDDPKNNFPIYTKTGSSSGPGTVKTTPAAWSEAYLCNIWPYWYSSSQFGAGNGCMATQYVFAPSWGPAITSDPGVWFGMNIQGGNIVNAQGWYHDSWYSVEARRLFAFNGAFDVQFSAADDTFVFINGVLMIDLGGPHERLPGKVHVNTDGSADIQEGGNIYMPCTNPTGQSNCPVIPAGYQVGDIVPCDGSANAIDPVTKVKFNSTCTGADKTTCDCRQRHLTAAQTGLTPPSGAGAPANTYEIAVFKRDGHPLDSNLELTVTGFSTNRSICQPTSP